METWKATQTPFSVPGHGLCSYSAEDPQLPPVCRYPFKTPELNLVSAPLAIGSCRTTAGQPAQTVPGQGVLGGTVTALDFDPVVTAPLALLPNGRQPPQGAPPLLLCPGTPLSFIEATKSGRNRFEVDEKQLILENYSRRVKSAASTEQPMQAPGLPQQPGPLQQP